MSEEECESNRSAGEVVAEQGEHEVRGAWILLPDGAAVRA